MVFVSSWSFFRLDRNAFGLFVTKAKAIAAKAKLDRIAEWRSTNDLDTRARAKAHFQQASAEFAVGIDFDDGSTLADPEPIQRARLGTS